MDEPTLQNEKVPAVVREATLVQQVYPPNVEEVNGKSSALLKKESVLLRKELTPEITPVAALK